MVYSKNKKYSRNKISKKLFPLLVVAVLSLAVFYVWQDKNNQQKPSNTEDSQTIINLDPPSNTEQQAGDEIKPSLPNGDGSNNNSQTQLAEVVIVDASQYGQEIEVRAFVANLVQNGTCTITFSKAGENTFSETATAYPDASTTLCSTTVLNRSKFSAAGSWNVEVSFSSSSSTGVARSEIIIE